MSSVKPKPSDEKNQDKEKKTYTFDYLATSKFINFDALKQKSPYPSIRDISTEELEALSTALDMTPISILNANFSLTPEACWHEVESLKNLIKDYETRKIDEFNVTYRNIDKIFDPSYKYFLRYGSQEIWKKQFINEICCLHS